MDQYLFYQTHKRQLHDMKIEDTVGKASFMEEGKNDENLRMSITQKSFFTQKINEMERLGKLPGSQLASHSSPRSKMQTPPAPQEGQEEEFNPFELTDETMKPSLDVVSGKYEEDYIKAGYPPKIASTLLKQLCHLSKLRVQILDVGCGKGLTGEYLKKDGFMHITGMDASQSLLNVASEKKCYENLQRVAFGLTPSVITDEHRGKYDFVISPTMINNDGWDRNIFMDLLSLVKMGGFLIFATKLNLHQENQYHEQIKTLETQQHWKYVTEHTFFRYDKLCDGQGKFSHKKVKILAYQKTDHNVWRKSETVRLDSEQKAKDEERKKREDMENARNAKLAAAGSHIKERRKRLEKEKSEKLAEEQRQFDIQREEELRIEEANQKIMLQAKIMEEKLKEQMKIVLWKRLKEEQAKEVEKREKLREEAMKKYTKCQTLKVQINKTLDEVEVHEEVEPESPFTAA